MNSPDLSLEGARLQPRRYACLLTRALAPEGLLDRVPSFPTPSAKIHTAAAAPQPLTRNVHRRPTAPHRRSHNKIPAHAREPDPRQTPDQPPTPPRVICD